MRIDELRIILRDHGYIPTPVDGKRPILQGWQERRDPSNADIVSWRGAMNTGILAETTPAFDIDILDPPASQAVEDLVLEWFGALGRVMVRTGLAPKRAIPFRTSAPFEKLKVEFEPRGFIDGKPVSEKLEFLGKGQQFVAFGFHPEAGKPYKWRGGDPSEVRWDQLPEMSHWEARELIKAAAKLLVDEFGYTVKAPPAPKPVFAQRISPRVKGTAYSREAEPKIAGVLKRITTATRGERNDILFWGACVLCDLIKQGAADPHYVIDSLTDAGRRIGLTGREIESTLGSATRRMA